MADGVAAVQTQPVAKLGLDGGVSVVAQHQLSLYRVSETYTNSLDQDSKMFAPEKGPRRQRQMLIDIYLDTCNALGIAPEPIVVSVCGAHDTACAAAAANGGSGEALVQMIDALDLSGMSMGNKSVVALCTALAHRDCQSREA